MTISLESTIAPERVILLKAADKEAAIQELAQAISQSPDVGDGEALLEAILDREQPRLSKYRQKLVGK